MAGISGILILKKIIKMKMNKLKFKSLRKRNQLQDHAGGKDPSGTAEAPGHRGDREAATDRDIQEITEIIEIKIRIMITQINLMKMIIEIIIEE